MKVYPGRKGFDPNVKSLDSIPIEDFLKKSGSADEDYPKVKGIRSERDYLMKRSYFLEQVYLMRTLCSDYNKEAQKIIQQLMPPEFLLYVLNSPPVGLNEKKAFIELMIDLYIENYMLEYVGDSLMPETLVWTEVEIEQSKENMINEERNKLFTLKAFQRKDKLKGQTLKAAPSTTIREAPEHEELSDHGAPPKVNSSMAFSEPEEEEKINDVINQALNRPNSKGMKVAEMMDMIQPPRDTDRTITEQEGELSFEDEFTAKGKNYSIKHSLTNMKAVLQNRHELHSFVVAALDNLDYHWNSSDATLTFFVAFLRMIELLILRGFFNQKYDKFL